MLLVLGNHTSNEDACQCVAHGLFGPYCERWGGTQQEWCYLKNSSTSQYCPGARSLGDLYYTKDKITCNKSESMLF